MALQGNQSIATATATELTLQSNRGNIVYVIIINNSTANFYFSRANTVSNLDGESCIIPAGKSMAIKLGINEEIWVYQNSGSNARIDWYINSGNENLD